MTPFASVAILEKLALLKIARCRAPALSNASSASLRAVLSVPSAVSISVLVSPLLLVMVEMVLPSLNHHRAFLDKRIILDDRYHGYSSNGDAHCSSCIARF